MTDEKYEEKVVEHERERLELIKGNLSYEVITEWIARTGSDPDDMVHWDLEDWINNFNEAVLMLNDEMDKVAEAKQELLDEELKAIRNRNVLSAPLN